MRDFSPPNPTIFSSMFDDEGVRRRFREARTSVMEGEAGEEAPAAADDARGRGGRQEDIIGELGRLD